MYPFIFVRTTPADSPLAGADEPPMLDLLRFHRAPRCNSMGAGRCVSCWLLLEIDGHPTVLQYIFLQHKWNLTGSTMFNPQVFLVISAFKKNWRDYSMISDRWFPCLLAISPNIPNFCWLIWSGESKNGHAQNCTPDFFLSDRFFSHDFLALSQTIPKPFFKFMVYICLPSGYLT